MGIRVFGSDQFDLFGFRVIRVEMFRNHLGTGYFLDRFSSGNTRFLFFIKPKVEPYYK